MAAHLYSRWLHICIQDGHTFRIQDVPKLSIQDGRTFVFRDGCTFVFKMVSHIRIQDFPQTGIQDGHTVVFKMATQLYSRWPHICIQDGYIFVVHWFSFVDGFERYFDAITMACWENNKAPRIRCKLSLGANHEAPRIRCKVSVRSLGATFRVKNNKTDILFENYFLLDYNERENTVCFYSNCPQMKK